MGVTNGVGNALLCPYSFSNLILALIHFQLDPFPRSFQHWPLLCPHDGLRPCFRLRPPLSRIECVLQPISNKDVISSISIADKKGLKGFIDRSHFLANLIRGLFSFRSIWDFHRFCKTRFLTYRTFQCYLSKNM